MMRIAAIASSSMLKRVDRIDPARNAQHQRRLVVHFDHVQRDVASSAMPTEGAVRRIPTSTCTT